MRLLEITVGTIVSNVKFNSPVCTDMIGQKPEASVAQAMFVVSSLAKTFIAVVPHGVWALGFL